MKKIILILLLFFGWKQYYHIESASSVGAGMLAGGSPFQSETERRSFRDGDYTYTPHASFEVDARVLDASYYYFDKMSRISPMDIVVGWEEMSDESVYDLVDISTGSRKYDWDAGRAPIAPSEIALKTAIIHLVPANPGIAHEFRRIRIGDIIVARGYLVDVKSAAGLKWKTSTTRNDDGPESGEILYVNSLEIVEPYSRIYF